MFLLHVIGFTDNKNIKTGEPKMMNLNNNNVAMTTTAAKTYADIKNARYTLNASHIVSIEQRWNETYNSLSTINKVIVDGSLEQAKAEFRRANPTITTWNDLLLAEAKDAVMNQISIDGTMQRQLDIFWVLILLNKFLSTKVVPIQVYRPDPTKDEFLAWDGQHTLMLLWIIATKILNEDPSAISIPVNIYHTNLKSEMRATFISHNSSEGKKSLEQIDIWEQMIYGVRVDGSKNPLWIEAEKKQTHIESVGLFVTANKFNDTDEPGAISRLQEINKLNVDSVGHLATYLALSTKLQRPVVEKEIVLMAHYFDRCRVEGIAIDNAYIFELSQVVSNHWQGDFTPQGTFWDCASKAYNNWHLAHHQALAQHGIAIPDAKFKKEPVHGFPYLIAQLKKSMPTRRIPRSDSNSPFVPLQQDIK